MTRWVINIGDLVLVSSGGEKYEGILLTDFVFKGVRHYIVDVGETFICSTVIQPNKKQELAIKRSGGYQGSQGSI